LVIVLLLNLYTSECHDAKVPFSLDILKWYVPCPKFSVGIEGIFEVLQLPVWLAIISVLFLASLMFWQSAKSPFINVTRESNN
jgi:hypothetical protein